MDGGCQIDSQLTEPARPSRLVPMGLLSRFSSPRTSSAAEVFFVVGHPRSGTNWVSNLLNLHPHVFCDGEFHFHDLFQSVERITDEPWRGAHREPARTALRDAFADLVRRTLVAAASKKPAATRIGDRTPRHLVPLIPGCRHVVCARDGRDVLVSWTFHMLKAGGPWLTQGEYGPAMSVLKVEFDHDPAIFERQPQRLLAVDAWLRHYARQWADRVNADLAMTRCMAEDPGLGSAHWLLYERLHAEVDAQCAALYTYLGVDPAHAPGAATWDITQPGFTKNDPRAFFRSGKVGDWKRYFTDEQLRVFTDEAGAANEQLQRLPIQ